MPTLEWITNFALGCGHFVDRASLTADTSDLTGCLEYCPGCGTMQTIIGQGKPFMVEETIVLEINTPPILDRQIVMPGFELYMGQPTIPDDLIDWDQFEGNIT